MQLESRHWSLGVVMLQLLLDGRAPKPTGTHLQGLQWCEVICLSVTSDSPDLSAQMNESFQKIREANREASSSRTSTIAPSSSASKPVFRSNQFHDLVNNKHEKSDAEFQHLQAMNSPICSREWSKTI